MPTQNWEPSFDLEITVKGEGHTVSCYIIIDCGNGG